MEPPEISGVSIVLLGSFSPAIFHPSWFKANNLIRPEEADNAKLEITHSELSSFSVDWFKISVLLDRFQVETIDEAHIEPLRDLVVSIFSLLEHTPISKMGINRMMHFRMPTEEKWHGFGHLVAPKDHWKEIMTNPGLISLTMMDSKKDSKNFTKVKVEPSNRVLPYGVYIEVNNHYDTEDKEDKNGLRQLMDTLRNSWKDVINKSGKIAEHLLEKGQ